MFTLLFAAIVSLLALFAGFWAWNRFTDSGNISALTESGDRFEHTAPGKAKRAHDRLVKMGRKALPGLRLRNEQLIAEHAAFPPLRIPLPRPIPGHPITHGGIHAGGHR